MPTIIFGTVAFVVLIVAVLAGALVGGQFGFLYGILVTLAIVGGSLAAWRLAEKRKDQQKGTPD